MTKRRAVKMRHAIYEAYIIILLAIIAGLLTFALWGCSANPACDPQRWADLIVAVPAIPYCAIRVAENQCGPQGCGGIPQGRSGNYTILGPGNDVAFVIAN